MNTDSLKQSIIKTLSYFDLQGHPLTAPEIWQWLYKNDTDDFKEVLAALDELEVQNKIARRYGFFYLLGSEDLVERRRAQSVVAELKLKKARKAAKFIIGVPFLKAIFVCNSVANGTAVSDSDIDFFIITEKNRLYITRFFVNLILRAFGLRTYGDKMANRICLSFFVDDQNLSLEKLKALPEDIHFVYWSLRMIPIYDPKNYFKRFLSANFWMKKYVPNFSTQTQYIDSVKPNIFSSVFQKVWQTMWRGQYGDLVETQAREWQLLKMGLRVKEKIKAEDNGVVVNNGVVKLHEHDTRAAIYESWINKIKEQGL